MKITTKMFNAIEGLYDQLHGEIAFNAQGDNGQDVRDRREEYRKKLEKLLVRASRPRAPRS